MEDEDGDRISSLPLEIIISILCCMDVRYAVRTSALARSWRHHWRLLPCLRIGRFLPFLELEDSLTGDKSYSCYVSCCWIKKVHHLVSSLQGPILVFKLSQYFRHYQTPELQSLLDLLLEKGGVQSLCLFSHCDHVFVRLPFFRSLKVLQLYACKVVLPTGDFAGFKHLITLDLEKVYISHDDLCFLIRTSNNLTTFRNLGLVNSNHPLSLNLCCPSLRHLQFEINESIEKVSVVSAPCLEEAHICIEKFTESEKFASVNLGLLISVAQVSSLTLDCHVLGCLSLVIMPFNFTFPRLRCLNLFWDITTMDVLYDTFLQLVRSMPFLEELQLVIGWWYWSTDRNWNENRELIGWKQDGLPCLDRSLKRVTISIQTCDIAKISIIVAKFFLLNAKVLKLMNIQYMYLNVISLMRKELQGAEVTSSDAIVVFLDLMGNVIN